MRLSPVPGTGIANIPTAFEDRFSGRKFYGAGDICRQFSMDEAEK
jgi:hypothetical protein